jgi:hypothetical protein
MMGRKRGSWIARRCLMMLAGRPSAGGRPETEILVPTLSWAIVFVLSFYLWTKQTS